jgi:uncharacterized protein YcaQ
METISISKQTARRFLLGRQGLWPGRRWAGKDGVVQAIRTMEALQLDPLNVVARSHDLALYGRVLDYRPEWLEQVTYDERRFFDYGGSLYIYPMEEFPYWRAHMQRWEQGNRWADFSAANSALMQEVRQALRERGPLGNRDFDGKNRVTGNYRGRKDSSLALYSLWITGETMIHHRQNFQRLYDFRENVVPSDFDYAASEQEAEAYFARKAVAFRGLISEVDWKNIVGGYLNRRIEPDEAHTWIGRLIEQGGLKQVRVEGMRRTYLVLTDDLPMLDCLESGDIPQDWSPLEMTTDEEAVILAPLEIVSARGRAAEWFDFEYIWEVYKPVEQRRWGYYNVPVLYGDRLVARLDPKLDRASQTLQIKGFWLDDESLERDVDFQSALDAGLQRLMEMIGAERLAFER